MKKFLHLLLFLTCAISSMHAQSTWVQRISYNLSTAYLHDDSICGIQDVSVSLDGNLYMVAKGSQDNSKAVFKMAPDSHTVLWGAYLGWEQSLQGDDGSFVRATADSGCIFAINYHSFAANPWGQTTIIKYSKNGVVNWQDTLGHDPATYITNDIIQNAAGNYYALIYASGGDSLIEFNDSGTIVFETAAVHGDRLFEMNNGELLVHQTSLGFNDSLLRVDLSGAISWNVPTNRYDLFAFSDSTAFICHRDTTALLSTITKVNVNNGNIIWIDSIFSLSISALDATLDGGVIASEGNTLLFYAVPTNMTGKLYKINSAGGLQWTHAYTFPMFGLSTVKQTPDGMYVTGGTYHACGYWLQFERGYAGFAAMLDSSGNGTLETAENIWPGDASGNDTIWLAEDILYTALALNTAGFPRDGGQMTDPYFYSDYAVDWSQSFPNGTNYKHADMNGDGIVDMTDINPLIPIQYFWIPDPVDCRTSSNGLVSSVPDLFLLPEKDTVAPGELMHFFIVAGSTSQSIDSVFGISFLNQYDVTLTDSTVININYSNSDFGNPSANLICFAPYAQWSGQILCIMARNDQQNVYQLYDTLGVIELKASPDITLPQTFNLQIISLYAMTNSTSLVSMNPVSGTVVIDPALVSVMENNLSSVNIFPNPANKFLSINNLIAGEKQICIYNMSGEKIKNILSSATSFKIPVTDLKNGTYSIEIISRNNRVAKKFEVKH